MGKGLIVAILICLCIIGLAISFRPTGRSKAPTPLTITPLLKRSASKSTPDPISDNVRRIIAEDNSFREQDLEDAEFKELFSQFEINSQVKLSSKFEQWQSVNSVFEDLCDFGYQLLHLYEKLNHKNRNYEAIAADVIRKIGEAMKSYKTGDKVVLGFATQQVYNITFLAKLLVAYEYIGNDEAVKRSICHSLIIKMVPTIDQAVGELLGPSLLLHFGMIRLLTNYLYDKNTYNNELRQINESKTMSSLNITINNSDKIEPGIYRDGSCISFSNVASYEHLTSFYRYPNYIFYENICKVIGPRVGNLPTIVTTVLEKIYHPQINYVPFGLFDMYGMRSKGSSWNVQGVIGVFIFPFIGLGVFKNHEMMFSVRVQRPNIAAGMANVNRVNDYILGSIQLRRIYQINRTYSDSLEWNTLYEEPGIISAVNAGSPIYYANQLRPGDNTYSCEDVDQHNLIGRLPNNENVMFWFNKYQCSLIQCSVTEVGLMTDNGLEIHSLIHNYGTLEVQLRVDDEPPSDVDRKLISICDQKNEHGFVVIQPSETKRVSWAMVFDDRTRSNLKYDGRMREFTFNYKSKVYRVKLKENSQYIVEVGRNEYIFGGSSSSDPNDSMTLDGLRPLQRDPQTLMYT